MTGLEAVAASASGRASLLQALREETMGLHAALDHRLRLGDRGCSTVDAYRALLRAASAVVTPLEVPLAIHLGNIFIVRSAGERAVRLHHDLSLLGEEPAPPAPDVPAIVDAADAFGAAYVLQGSHLGGEVIARTVRSELGLTDAHTSYLRLHEGAVGAAWSRFVGALERFGATLSEAAHDRVLAAAVATFTAFSTALDREGVPRP